jgi:hypothetical protein
MKVYVRTVKLAVFYIAPLLSLTAPKNQCLTKMQLYFQSYIAHTEQSRRVDKRLSVESQK